MLSNRKVVKPEMARVNIDILGISELKWTGMGEFNSDDHYIYYYGQESLWRNEKWKSLSCVQQRECVNLIQMTTISTTVGKNPLEGME